MNYIIRMSDIETYNTHPLTKAHKSLPWRQKPHSGGGQFLKSNQVEEYKKPCGKERGANVVYPRNQKRGSVKRTLKMFNGYTHHLEVPRGGFYVFGTHNLSLCHLPSLERTL